jgi:hypothetical protein
MSQLHGILKEHICPGCGRRWEQAVAVCIECGHDFRSGGKLRRRVAESDTLVDMGFSGFLIRIRFIVRRDTKGRWWLIRKKSFLFFGVGTREFALSDYSAVATDFRQTEDDGDGVSDLYLEGRGRPTRIWSGTRDDRMRELIDLLHSGPGLAIRRK